MQTLASIKKEFSPLWLEIKHENMSQLNPGVSKTRGQIGRAQNLFIYFVKIWQAYANLLIFDGPLYGF